MRLLALTIILITLSGCFEGGEPLSQAAAEAAAENALEQFAADIASADGGDLRMFSGVMAFDAGEYGSFDMDFSMEWGQAETRYIQFSMDTDGEQMDMEMYCSPEGTVIISDGERIEDDSTECMEMDQIEQGFDFEEYGDVDNMTVEPQSDGSVKATFVQDGATVEVVIDRQGRLASMDLEMPMGSGSFDVDYGARRVIEMP